MNNSRDRNLFMPGRAFFVPQEQQSTQRFLCVAIMSGHRPCILVARRQVLYDRILSHWRFMNNIYFDFEDDSDVPDLVESSDDKMPELVDWYSVTDCDSSRVILTDVMACDAWSVLTFDVTWLIDCLFLSFFSCRGDLHLHVVWTFQKWCICHSWSYRFCLELTISQHPWLQSPPARPKPRLWANDWFESNRNMCALRQLFMSDSGVVNFFFKIYCIKNSYFQLLH